MANISLIQSFAPKKRHLARSMITENRSVSPKQNHCPKPTWHCNMFRNICKKEDKRSSVRVEQKSIMTYEGELYSEEKIFEKLQ